MTPSFLQAASKWLVYKIRSEFEGGMKKMDALLPGVSGPQQGADISCEFWERYQG